jgi:DNA-directed RNA polymerase subunit alpha
MRYTHLSDTVEIKKISEEGNFGVFHVEGLYTGYGTTLGHSLRRVLLSSIPGAAITQIKVKGANHEFSAIPGMMEDVLQFTLNLKKVRFHFLADEPQTITLKAKGECEVTAGDITSTPFAQVVNTDLHLASLTKKNAELDVELTIEKGLGYVPAESRTMERLLVGTIVLDAIFSPVENVSISVENMRVGQRTDYNRLKIEITTDGSISPSEALHKSVSILRDHFEKLGNFEVTPVLVPTEGAPKEKKTTKKAKK